MGVEMSKIKYWQYVCDFCGGAEHFHTEAEAKNSGWKKRGKADYCTKACWRQSKEHSI